VASRREATRYRPRPDKRNPVGLWAEPAPSAPGAFAWRTLFTAPGAFAWRTLFTAEHLAAPMASFVHSFPAETDEQLGT
jgi:hypothetical protein